MAMSIAVEYLVPARREADKIWYVDGGPCGTTSWILFSEENAEYSTLDV